MKKALQLFEKTTKMTYHSTMSNLNYRMQVKSEGMVMGSVNLHLNKANPLTNMMVYDLLHKKEYTLLKEETRMIFQGDFEALRNLSEVTTYYPDTGNNFKICRSFGLWCWEKTIVTSSCKGECCSGRNSHWQCHISLGSACSTGS